MVWQGKRRKQLRDFPNQRQLAVSFFGLGAFLFLLGAARWFWGHGDLAEVGAWNVFAGCMLLLAGVPSWQRR